MQLSATYTPKLWDCCLITEIQAPREALAPGCYSLRAPTEVSHAMSHAIRATLVLILVWNLSSNDNGPPNTTFGNMHAF
jgi:hypothetical protein